MKGNLRYLLANLVLLILAATGVFYLTGLILEDLLIDLLGDKPSVLTTIKILISIVFAIFPGIPTVGMMHGFLKGRIRVYSALVSLSRIFSKDDDDNRCWKMLFQIIILKVLGRKEFVLKKISLQHYVDAHTAGAILARESWTSIYWAPLYIWNDLVHPFVARYVSEVKILPNQKKRRFIIAPLSDIQNSLNDHTKNAILRDAANMGAETYVIDSESPDFSAIEKQIQDFSSFDDLVMIYLPQDQRKKLEEKTRSVQNLGLVERMKELKKFKLNAVIAVNSLYRNGRDSEFGNIADGASLLAQLPGSARKRLTVKSGQFQLS